jgi:hypothetical protein
MFILNICLLLINSDFIICGHEEQQFQPSVIYVDSLYYVFWSDYRQAMSIYGARVRPDGTVIDTQGVFFYQGYSVYGLRTAYDDQNIFFVFRYGC